MAVEADKQKRLNAQEPRLRAGQFLRFMQIVSVFALGLGVTQVGLAVFMRNVQMAWLAGLTLSLALFAHLSRLLTRSGRLSAGITLWSTGLFVDLSIYPLVAEDMLPVVLLGGVINIVLVALFLSPQQIKWVALAGLVFAASSTWLERWAPWPRFPTKTLPLLIIFINTVGLGLVAFLINLLGETLLSALESSRVYAGELEQSHATLIKQTDDLKATTAELVTRTGELEKLNLEFRNASHQAQRRAELLATSALVARTVGQLRDLEELLSRVALLISQAFNYYHVGIFTLDELGRFAVLGATNSEGGQRMLERGYKVAVEADNLVGSVAVTGQPRVARDVGPEAIHFDYPDLPETRSEIALPLSAGGQLFGVFDVHSTQESAFTEEDISILGSLADQIAIAVENARLLTQTRDALREAQEAQARYLRREWEQLLPTLRTAGHEYHVRGVPEVGDMPLPEIEHAIRMGDVVTVSPASATPPAQAGAYAHALAVPIKLRDQIIGVIDLHETDDSREWTEDDVAIVTEIADQAAQALENVRLFEQTQQQARREQLTATIAARLRAAPNVEGVLKATVHEIRRALGVSHGVVRLKTGETQTVIDTTA